MMRTYQLIRCIPDPVRGESLNLGLVAFVDDHAVVKALSASDIRKRMARIAPHVEPANAVAFMAELTASAGNINAVRQLLEVFDPHFRVDEPRRIAAAVDIDVALSAAWRDLVAIPGKQRSKAPRGRWTVQKALALVGESAPTFASTAVRSISVQKRPDLFGLEGELLGPSPPPTLPPFDAVLPNCVRVLALKGLVTSEQMAAAAFFDTRITLQASVAYFGSVPTSKDVLTGALLLPHTTEQVSPAIRYEMGRELGAAVSRIEVPGLEPRPAVFDLSDPADASYLERLAHVFKQSAT